MYRRVSTSFSVPAGLDKIYLNERKQIKQVQLSGLHTDKELDPINWESIIENDNFIDDSVKDAPENQTDEDTEGIQSRFYHAQLRDKYQLIERRDSVKVCDVFEQQSVSSLHDQEEILVLWDSTREVVYQSGSLRRGEELFHFVDQEELGSQTFEKFVAFHLDTVGANHYGEVTFESFVHVYQLIEAQYRSPHSILGRLFQRPLDISTSEENSEGETQQDEDWHQYRLELLHRVTYLTIPENHMLFEQDQELTGIYFVFQGSIQIFRKTEEGELQIIGNVGPGGNYGIMEFISGQKLLLNGMATKKTWAIKLPVDGFDKLLSRDWKFTWSILSSTLMDIKGMQTVLQSEALSFRSPPPGQLQKSKSVVSISRSSSTVGRTRKVPTIRTKSHSL